MVILNKETEYGKHVVKLVTPQLAIPKATMNIEKKKKLLTCNFSFHISDEVETTKNKKYNPTKAIVQSVYWLPPKYTGTKLSKPLVEMLIEKMCFLCDKQYFGFLSQMLRKLKSDGFYKQVFGTTIQLDAGHQTMFDYIFKLIANNKNFTNSSSGSWALFLSLFYTCGKKNRARIIEAVENGQLDMFIFSLSPNCLEKFVDIVTMYSFKNIENTSQLEIERRRQSISMEIIDKTVLENKRDPDLLLCLFRDDMTVVKNRVDWLVRLSFSGSIHKFGSYFSFLEQVIAANELTLDQIATVYNNMFKNGDLNTLECFSCLLYSKKIYGVRETSMQREIAPRHVHGLETRLRSESIMTVALSASEIESFITTLLMPVRDKAIAIPPTCDDYFCFKDTTLDFSFNILTCLLKDNYELQRFWLYKWLVNIDNKKYKPDFRGLGLRFRRILNLCWVDDNRQKEENDAKKLFIDNLVIPWDSITSIDEQVAVISSLFEMNFAPRFPSKMFFDYLFDKNINLRIFDHVRPAKILNWLSSSPIHSRPSTTSVLAGRVESATTSDIARPSILVLSVQQKEMCVEFFDRFVVKYADRVISREDDFPFSTFTSCFTSWKEAEKTSSSLSAATFFDVYCIFSNVIERLSDKTDQTFERESLLRLKKFTLQLYIREGPFAAFHDMQHIPLFECLTDQIKFDMMANATCAWSAITDASLFCNAEYTYIIRYFERQVVVIDIAIPESFLDCKVLHDLVDVLRCSKETISATILYETKNGEGEEICKRSGKIKISDSLNRDEQFFVCLLNNYSKVLSNSVRNNLDFEAFLWFWHLVPIYFLYNNKETNVNYFNWRSDFHCWTGKKNRKVDQILDGYHFDVYEYWNFVAKRNTDFMGFTPKFVVKPFTRGLISLDLLQSLDLSSKMDVVVFYFTDGKFPHDWFYYKEFEELADDHRNVLFCAAIYETNSLEHEQIFEYPTVVFYRDGKCDFTKHCSQPDGHCFDPRKFKTTIGGWIQQPIKFKFDEWR